MDRLPSIYRLLAESDNLAADEALLEGLAAGEIAYVPAMVATLLTRAQPAGMAGLVSLFHVLDEPLQQQLVHRSEKLFCGLRESIRAEQIQTRLNTVAIIRRSACFRACYLLALALRDSSSRVRQEAATALRDLAAAALERSGRLPKELAGGGEPSAALAGRQAIQLAAISEEHNYLVAGVLEAAQAFNVHFRTEVAEAAVWLAHWTPPAFWNLLSQQPGRLAHAVYEAFESSNDSRLVPFAYRALAVPQLRQQVARSIASRRNQAFVAELVKQAWLLGDARIRRGFTWVRSFAWLAGGVEPLLELPEHLQARGVAVIGASGLATEDKVELFAELLLVGSRAAQRAAVWALVQIPGERSDQLLRTVLAWNDAELSRIAFYELLRRQPSRLPLRDSWRHGEPSGPASEIDRQTLVDVDFQEYWDRFEQLDAQSRVAAGKALAESLPELLKGLRTKLGAKESTDRLRALRIAGSLGLSRHLQPEVIRLSGDRDPFVRATAVGALGQIGGPVCEGILRRALHDEDKRVQANAIEALDQLAVADKVPFLFQKLDDPNNRVRANTVRALLRPKLPQAARSLLEMLSHPNRMHRVSAIWVIETLNLIGLAVRVVRMAQEDPDAHVRRVAARAVAALHRGLSDSAAPAAAEASP